MQVQGNPRTATAGGSEDFVSGVSGDYDDSAGGVIHFGKDENTPVAVVSKRLKISCFAG